MRVAREAERVKNNQTVENRRERRKQAGGSLITAMVNF
jgi:hypothetical protein